MARIRFNATLPDISVWQKKGILRSENLVLLKHGNDSSIRVKEALRKMFEKDQKRKDKGEGQVIYDVVIDEVRDKRSIKANNLMWALYTLEAEALNRENRRPIPITPEELYRKDMEDGAPRHFFFCTEADLPFFKIILERDYGHVVREDKIENGFISVEIMETSSYWNSKKMSEHIQGKLNELETMGITKGSNGDISRVFDDFEKWKEEAGSDGEEIGDMAKAALEGE